MKLLTLNFLTCARKTCKTTNNAFPLHPKEAELEQIEIDMNPLFIKNMLPRLDWEAMRGLTQEVRYFIQTMRITIADFHSWVYQTCRKKFQSQKLWPTRMGSLHRFAKTCIRC